MLTRRAAAAAVLAAAAVAALLFPVFTQSAVGHDLFDEGPQQYEHVNTWGVYTSRSSEKVVCPPGVTSDTTYLCTTETITERVRVGVRTTSCIRPGEYDGCGEHGPDFLFHTEPNLPLPRTRTPKLHDHPVIPTATATATATPDPTPRVCEKHAHAGVGWRHCVGIGHDTPEPACTSENAGQTVTWIAAHYEPKSKVCRVECAKHSHSGGFGEHCRDDDHATDEPDCPTVNDTPVTLTWIDPHYLPRSKVCPVPECEKHSHGGGLGEHCVDADHATDEPACTLDTGGQTLTWIDPHYTPRTKTCPSPDTCAEHSHGGGFGEHCADVDHATDEPPCPAWAGGMTRTWIDPHYTPRSKVCPKPDKPETDTACIKHEHGGGLGWHCQDEGHATAEPECTTADAGQTLTWTAPHNNPKSKVCPGTPEPPEPPDPEKVVVSTCDLYHLDRSLYHWHGTGEVGSITRNRDGKEFHIVYYTCHRNHDCTNPGQHSHSNTSAAPTARDIHRGICHDAHPPLRPSVRLSASPKTILGTWRGDTHSGPITDYDVQYRVAAVREQLTGGAWRIVAAVGEPIDVAHGGAATTAQVGGLVNGTAYQMRVRAENAHGESDWSLWSGQATPLDVPGRQAAPPLFPATVNSLRVGLVPPADDGGTPISGYTVRHRRSGETDWTIRPGRIGSLSDHISAIKDWAYETSHRPPARRLHGYQLPTSHTVHNLHSGGTYEVQIRARNLKGTGPWSPTSTVTLRKPNPLECMAADGGVWFSWANDGNSQSWHFSGFDFSISPNIRFAFQASTDNRATWSPADPLTTGLTANQLRSGWLRLGYNNSGYQTFVEAAPGVREVWGRTTLWRDNDYTTVYTSGATRYPREASCQAYLPPGPPTLTAVGGEQQVSLAWSPPASDGGKPITGWRFQWRKAGDLWSQTVEYPASTTTRLLTGLEDATTYEALVAAVNSVGVGPWVKASATTLDPLPIPEIYSAACTGVGPYLNVVVRRVDEAAFYEVRLDGAAAGTTSQSARTIISVLSRRGEYDRAFRVSVRARDNDSAFSAWSLERTVTCPSLPAPDIYSAACTGNTPDLSVVVRRVAEAEHYDTRVDGAAAGTASQSASALISVLSRDGEHGRAFSVSVRTRVGAFDRHLPAARANQPRRSMLERREVHNGMGGGLGRRLPGRDRDRRRRLSVRLLQAQGSEIVGRLRDVCRGDGNKGNKGQSGNTVRKPLVCVDYPQHGHMPRA